MDQELASGLAKIMVRTPDPPHWQASALISAKSRPAKRRAAFLRRSFSV